MADKEATVYIVDVGRSMGEKRDGRTESDLDWAMRYVWDKITSTIATERKTACLGVIGLRTDGSDNELDAEEAFEHITVFQEIGQMLLPGLITLRKNIKLSNTDQGDAISAIVVAIQMITKFTKKLKYIRKIILVTDARGSIEADGIEDIASKMTAESIELVVIGVDFDDPEYGFKEEAKSFQKALNEDSLKKLVDSCDGVFGTLLQAIEELGVPRLKSTRPLPSYKGQITLGSPLQFDTALCIDVERYPRVMIRKPLSASSYVQRSTDELGITLPETDSDPANLTSVRNTRTYKVADETAPGGVGDVNRDALAKGYDYGRTIVPISNSDENVTKLETEAGLEVIGFIPWSSYEHYMSMSVSSLIIGQKLNTKAAMALSSLIHALYELESYAIARLVPKANKNPVLVLLAPSIEADYECLLDVQLPFAEDVRSYKFPPLDRIVTVSGKAITVHRNLPTGTLNSAMSDYVDSMDLSTFGRDDEGRPAEYMPMSETYSPVLHRIDQAIRWRAVNPNEPIPPPHEILVKYSKPPEELVVGAKRKLEKLVSLADVKKVPPKVKGRKKNRTEVKPYSGLNVEELLQSGSGKKSIQISPQNPIPGFRQMLDVVESISGIRDAVTQLGFIIETQIKDSFGDINYGRAIEELDVMRSEMIEIEEPAVYNDFVRALKTKLLKGELSGDRRDMWYELKKAELGLIDSKQSETSTVTKEEVKQFLSSNL